MKNRLLLVLFLTILFACENKQKTNEIDYSHIPEAFTVKIDLPAGKTDNQKFLPAPGNISYFDDAKKLQVITLAASLKKGETIAVRSLGVLQLRMQNMLQQIIIASPLDTNLQLSPTTNFQEFIAANAGEKQIIQDWYLYKNGLGKVELIGWKDEKYALEQISKALSNE